MPTKAERTFVARDAVCSRATWAKLEPEITRLARDYAETAPSLTHDQLRALAIGHLLSVVADAITEGAPTP
jgi:hypothetical protein